MRLTATGAFATGAFRAGLAAIGLAATLSACVSVDPEDTAERAAAGAALGAGVGAGVGTTIAINPLLGAVIGADVGAAAGGALGVLSSPPAPTYRPIAVPAEAVIPDFYDGWAPSYHAPPTNPETQPPRAG